MKTKTKVLLGEGFVLLELENECNRKIVYRNPIGKAVIHLGLANAKTPPVLLDEINSQVPISMTDLFPLADFLKYQFQIITILDTIDKLPSFGEEQLNNVSKNLKVKTDGSYAHRVSKCLERCFELLTQNQLEFDEFVKEMNNSPAGDSSGPAGASKA